VQPLLSETHGTPTVFEEGARVRRLIPVFWVGSAFFFLYDLVFAYWVEPTTNLKAVATLRLLIVVIVTVMGTRLSLSTAQDLRRAMTLFVLLVTPCFAATSVFTGGIGSLYGFAQVFFAVALAITGRPRREIYWFELGVFVSYPLTLMACSVVVPTLRAQWSDAHQRGTLLTVLGFLSAMCVMSAEISHLLWSLRREVFESKRVGRYVLRKRIGRGGMGEVWSAWHVGLKREVAVKFLHAQMQDDLAIKRFERESRATASLEHPNTVKVLDAGVADDGQPYYAMELLTGQSLRALIEQQGPLSSLRAARLLLQAARALGEAHSRGIIHRDIKPENLFVCAPGGDEVVKVLDFGIAKWLSDQEQSSKLTSTGWLAGTPAYMAPEVVQGASATAAADVYALGGVLYFMLTMTAPFIAEHASAVLFAHVGSPVERPSIRAERSIHFALETLTLRCLAKNPTDRYADGRAVADALELFLPELGEDAPTHQLQSVPSVQTTQRTALTVSLRPPAGD
jgi:serine/threonine-protein kinase